MARKATSSELANEMGNDNVKMRSYKAGKDNFTPLNEGEEVTGTFISLREKTIKDRRTRLPKTIHVYTLRGEDGMLKIGSRALLDSCFDDIMDEHGGFSLGADNKTYIGPGIEWITNRVVKFVRGDDEETVDKNPRGTYEILVEE